MERCFGATSAADKPERAYRFLEEAIELVQACGCSKEDVVKLIDYVYSRPPGVPIQEVGGVRITLAALCNALGINEDVAAEQELARCWKHIEKIRIRQQSKPHANAKA
jgi:hypothetical protein